jgi:hypothetical protein
MRASASLSHPQAIRNVSRAIRKLRSNTEADNSEVGDPGDTPASERRLLERIDLAPAPMPANVTARREFGTEKGRGRCSRSENTTI